jgi:hypothetical protein
MGELLNKNVNLNEKKLFKVYFRNEATKIEKLHKEIAKLRDQ